VLHYLAQESAGQCGPCQFGLPSLAGDFLAVAHGRADPELWERMARRLKLIAGRGACKHPDGAVRLAESALQTFSADLAWHLRGRPCAGINRRRGILSLPGSHQRDGGWQ
jgi:NADH:ubiquinone oxidoreductase subunit F (NADH-binding)